MPYNLYPPVVTFDVIPAKAGILPEIKPQPPGGSTCPPNMPHHLRMDPGLRRDDIVVEMESRPCP